MPPKPAANPDDHHLHQRGGVYYVRYMLGAKPIKQSLGTTDVRKARKKRDEILKDADARRDGRVVEREKTWQDAVDGYLAYQDSRVAAGELSAAAAKRYSCSIVQITSALGWEPNDGADGAPAKAILLSTVTKGAVVDFVEARREEERATSTVLNDLTAWSRVMAYAVRRDWLEDNPVARIDRKEVAGSRRQKLRPPTDEEVDALVREIAGWSEDMARLIRWLRETGMRLAEALNLRVEDIHPCGTKATLSRGVKRNRDGHGGMTRTIDLGQAAAMLADMPKKGRLFAALPADSAVVSTRYGQWCRQRQARQNRASLAEGQEPAVLDRHRLHDMRHAYACASLVDDDTCIYRLSVHLGHTMVQTTEIYTAHLRKNGAMWRYGRRPDLFGSLPPGQSKATRAA